MTSAARFYRAVRQFAQTSPVWDSSRVVYFTKPDERWDLSLVSKRVYGNRNETLAVMAAAGLDRYDQELTERELVLPSPQRLDALKQMVGYSNTATTPVR